MKRSTRKVINYLRKYIGHEVLRTKPACADWSYTSGSPWLLVGFTPDGCIKCRSTGVNTLAFGEKEYILPSYFTDRNWITYKKALKAKGNKLNKWKGKKIRRIRPTSIIGDNSYMSGDVTLISASKHHIVIMNGGGKRVLNSKYADPKDWELVE